MTRGYESDFQNVAYEEGREYRISLPLVITTSAVTILKFVAVRDFTLVNQALSCDTEGILFEAFRSTQGTEGGVFGTSIPIYSNNFRKDAPAMASTVTISTGGTFTPAGGQTSVETIRLRTAGSTAQASTVGNSVVGKRGLSAGTYYLKFTNLNGSGTANGVYTLVFQEAL